MQEGIIDFYRQPQMGGGMPVFTGSRRYQSGGGFFSTLARFALPLLGKVGKRALSVAARTATDVLDRHRPIKDALYDNTMQEVRTVFSPNASSPINKVGGGRGRRRRQRIVAGDIFSHKRLKCSNPV